MEWRAGQAGNMARASCKAPMDLLQRQVAEYPFSYVAAGIQSSNDGVLGVLVVVVVVVVIVAVVVVVGVVVG